MMAMHPAVHQSCCSRINGTWTQVWIQLGGGCQRNWMVFGMLLLRVAFQMDGLTYSPAALISTEQSSTVAWATYIPLPNGSSMVWPSLGSLLHSPMLIDGLALPKDVTLDGELFGGRQQFQSTVSIVKTMNSPHWKGITFQVRPPKVPQNPRRPNSSSCSFQDLRHSFPCLGALRDPYRGYQSYIRTKWNSRVFSCCDRGP